MSPLQTVYFFKSLYIKSTSFKESKISRVVYYTMVADCAIGPANNLLFIFNWWLAVPSAQPKLAAKFNIGW